MVASHSKQVNGEILSSMAWQHAIPSALLLPDLDPGSIPVHVASNKYQM